MVNLNMIPLQVPQTQGSILPPLRMPQNNVPVLSQIPLAPQQGTRPTNIPQVQYGKNPNSDYTRSTFPVSLQNTENPSQLTPTLPASSLSSQAVPRFIQFGDNKIDVGGLINKNTKPELLASIEKNAPVLINQYGINTPERQKQFLAQMAHESGGFATTEEYGKGQGKYKDPNSGLDYYGRGIIQLTHGSNYDKYGKLTGLDLVNNPALAAQPDNAVKIAGAYWADHNLNDLADSGDIRGITKAINGGYNGLAQRTSNYKNISVTPSPSQLASAPSNNLVSNASSILPAPGGPSNISLLPNVDLNTTPKWGFDASFS